MNADIIHNPEDGLARNVVAVVAKELGIEPDDLSLETGIGDIPEWDSVANLALLYTIEHAFNIVMDMDDMLRIETVEDIVDVVGNRLGP